MLENTTAPRILAFFLMVAGILITGCGGGDNSSVESNTAADRTLPVRTSTVNTGTVTITEADMGSTVNLAVGAVLQVVLKSNPSTGYHWVASVDQSCLQQSGGAIYTPDADTQGMPGAGGKDVFTFNAVSPCQASLLINYLTPTNLPSETTFSVTVSITK